MLRIFLLAALAVGSVVGEAELIIHHSPENVEFNGSHIDQSLLKKAFPGILGYTVKQPSPENSFSVRFKNVFALPEAVATIVIEGGETSEKLDGAQRFKLNVDEGEETTWQGIRHPLDQRDNRTLARIRLGDGLGHLAQSVIGVLNPNKTDPSSLKALNLTVPTDSNFLAEYELLRAIAQNVRSSITANNKTNAYWLVVNGLRPLINQYKESEQNDPAKIAEAFKLLNQALSDVAAALKERYKNNVVIAVIADDQSTGLHRVRREASKENEPAITSENPVESVIGTKEDAKTEETEEDGKIDKDKEEEGNRDDKGVDEANEAVVESSSSEMTLTFESTESPGRELNSRGHEIHSMTGDENNTTPWKEVKRNLAAKYDANYPAIFNIILWFGVAFLFSLIAICIAIADMDPGRDSIIYRMTSNRMKKDN